MGVKDQILSRMYVVLTFLALVPVLVAVQMVWIHLAEGEELRADGLRQARSESVLPARRGTIIDRSGRALVVNVPRYDLAVDPTFPGFKEASVEFYERLASLTHANARSYRRRVTEREGSKYVRLASLTTSEHLSVDSWDTPGVILEQSFRRRYNYRTSAAHVLGHVDLDGRGTAGLELQYDDRLRGVSGRRELLRDSRGYRRVDAAGTVVEPRDGQTLVLTLDLIRQTILEEELTKGVKEARARRGMAVAVNPETGAILAMANVPTYDPNRPDMYRLASRRNASVTDQMEPGSTFKLVGAAAAIETGVRSMHDEVDTAEGSITIVGRTMHDTHAHGIIPFNDVIALSSNVGMAKTAMLLKGGDLYTYARNFGFGQKTWIDLPGEARGLLKKTDRWSATTKTSMAIGYEISVTPLQLLMAYSALANGGLLRQPYVVAERRDAAGRTLWKATDDRARRDSVRRVIDEETAALLLPAFTDVVRRGTARRAGIEGLEAAGKTGTARIVQHGRYGSGYRATFVGFFPATNPEVAIIIVMDEPKLSIYGGRVSAPVFRRIAERWIGTFPNLAGELAPQNSLPDVTLFSVPDVTGIPAVEASRYIQAAGYRVEEPDIPLNPVVSQSPAAGTPLELGNAVRLSWDGATDTKEPRMPDLTGLGARSAVAWLTERGIRARLQGHGNVIGQSVEPGAGLPTEITLRLR